MRDHVRRRAACRCWRVAVAHGLWVLTCPLWALVLHIRLAGILRHVVLLLLLLLLWVGRVVVRVARARLSNGGIYWYFIVRVCVLGRVVGVLAIGHW